MSRYKNAPAEQAQNLSKDDKMGILEKDFENILAVTSKYYGEALEKFSNGEPSGKNEGSNSSGISRES